jgi:hypothetical protein
MTICKIPWADLAAGQPHPVVQQPTRISKVFGSNCFLRSSRSFPPALEAGSGLRVPPPLCSGKRHPSNFRGLRQPGAFALGLTSTVASSTVVCGFRRCTAMERGGPCRLGMRVYMLPGFPGKLPILPHLKAESIHLYLFCAPHVFWPRVLVQWGLSWRLAVTLGRSASD